MFQKREVMALIERVHPVHVLALLLPLLALFTSDVFAALPTDTNALLPADLENTDTPIDTAFSLGRYGVIGLAVILAGASVLAAGTQMVGAYGQASSGRSTWGNFTIVTLIGTVLVVIVVFLAILAVEYATG